MFCSVVLYFCLTVGALPPPRALCSIRSFCRGPWSSERGRRKGSAQPEWREPRLLGIATAARLLIVERRICPAASGRQALFVFRVVKGETIILLFYPLRTGNHC